jgi:hypothetical protein
MSKFVLVGTQRSGTTMLRTALDSHPDITCLGEVFYLNKDLKQGVVKQDKSAMGKDLSAGFSSWRKHSYQTYIEQSVGRCIQHWLLRGAVTRRYLDELYQLPGYRCIGFKMMDNQLKKFPAVLSYIKANDLRVVHLLRENPFDIMLSRLSMIARGYAHSGSTSGEAVSFYVSTDGLVEELQTIRDEGLRWKKVLEDSAPYMLVTYDRFVQERLAVSRELLSFLGVNSNIDLVSELVKLNTAPVSRIVQNFDEVQACLQKTEFEWCIF